MNVKIPGLTRKCPICKSIDVEKIIGTHSFYGCHNCRAAFEWKEEKEEMIEEGKTLSLFCPSCELSDITILKQYGSNKQWTIEYKCKNCKHEFSVIVNKQLGVIPPTTEFPSGAKRDLEGLRMDLVCPQSIIALASASAQGVPKYGERNWEKGIPTAILIGKAIIHLCRFRLKQIDGEEDLYEHLEHALWNIHAALHNVKCGKPHGEDDKI